MSRRVQDWQIMQWGLTYAALHYAGVGDAHQLTQQTHRHRDHLQRMLARQADLARLTWTELEERAREVGLDPELVDRCSLRCFVARIEVVRELRQLDGYVRAVTAARDWPDLEEALRRGHTLVLRYEGHPGHDAAVRFLRRRIAEGGYRVLPENPHQVPEEVPC